jgi:hypothetical protein
MASKLAIDFYSTTVNVLSYATQTTYPNLETLAG